jgi:hypothetical protein
VTRFNWKKLLYQRKVDPDAKKRFLILQSRVYIYPYAKLASERLTLLNKGMTRLSTNRERRSISR